MIFVGIWVDKVNLRLECALVDVNESGMYGVINERASGIPAEIIDGLEEVLSAGQPVLETLGRLHETIGVWLGEEAATLLKVSRVPGQMVELAGCQALFLPGGLFLGDLATAAQRCGLTLTAVRGQPSASACALMAWERWTAARQLGTEEKAGTEGRNPATETIDRLPALDLLRLINREDERPARAVASQLPRIAVAVEMVAERMRRGGRLLYVGAGTSGRIGVLDASEIPPTYGTNPEQVVGIIAGGVAAITGSLEGVEDDDRAGAQAMAVAEVGENDSVVGIAASGSTPFVIGALAEARQRGALTISLACNSPAQIEPLADIVIAPLVGPEVITGSTRMKAGTVQKMTLNMLSTGVMVRLGKTYGNLMVDVQASNAKLQARAERIVSQACEIPLPAAAEALEQASGEVKTAIVAVKAGIPLEEARRRLEQSGGIVRWALEMID